MDNQAIESILRISPVVTLVTGSDGRIVHFNEAAGSFFTGIKNGMVLSELVHELPLEEELSASKAVRLTADEDGRVTRLKLDDTNRPVVSILSKQLDDGKQVTFIRDVSSQVRYISKILQQQKTENELSRSSYIRNGDRDEALKEIAQLSAGTMDVDRVNIWLIGEGSNSISSLINYDRRKGGFLEKMVLYRHQFPNYFSLLLSEEIVPTQDALADPKTEEIRDGYILPLGIRSLIDVPVRIEGKMTGLICFEDTNNIREWTIGEQNFGIAIAQIVAQTIETHRRQIVQRELEQALSEKKLLLAEVNHRIKNNFSVISDLIRVQEERAADEVTKRTFSEIRSRLMSMAMIHRQLYASENIGAVNFRDFLLDLAAHFRATFSANGISISTLLDNCRLPINKAILCGLVVNELLTNSCRYAFASGESGLVRLRLSSPGGKIAVTVSDNGNGNTGQPAGFGTEMILELISKLGAKMEVKTENGTETSIVFDP